MRDKLSSVSRGLTLMTFGVILLLMNFNILSWGFWLNVIDLWPLILILAGIALFFNRRIPFSTVVLVFLLTLLGFSLTFGNRDVSFLKSFPGSKITNGTESIDIKMSNGLQRAEIDLNLGAAKFDLKALSGENNEQYFAQGSYTWEGIINQRPKITSRITGERIQLDLNSQKNLSPVGRNQLELGLSDKLIYDLDINSGAINGDLDFSRIKLDNLDLNTGASKFTLRFGDNNVHSRVKISCAASDLTLVIPENVGLRVHFSGVVSDTNFMGSGLILDNKDWVSQNYNQAKTKIDLNISTAAGSIKLERPIVATH